MRTDIDERKEDILKWISEGKSKSFICKELGCRHDTLNKAIKRLNIPKYKGNQGNKGGITCRNKTVAEYLKSTHIKSHKLKTKILTEGIKEYKCEKCNKTEWLDEPIPLELHHIDGDKFNNTLENIQLLCPNCHALTDTYRGKNIKRI